MDNIKTRTDLTTKMADLRAARKLLKAEFQKKLDETFAKYRADVKANREARAKLEAELVELRKAAKPTKKAAAKKAAKPKAKKNAAAPKADEKAATTAEG